MNHYEATTFSPPPPASRDDILQQLFDQATSVRRTFEESPYYSSAKRKHAVSSATAAAAHHMASVNRKRKFEHRIWTAASTASGGGSAGPAAQEIIAMPPSQSCFKQARHTFHSPISSYTRVSGEQGQRQQQQQVADAPLPPAPTCAVVEAPRAAQATGIVLSAYPADITLTYNDVICGSGSVTSSLVGNQRFKVWIEAHKSSFARATSLYQDNQIARSVVNTVMSSVPRGRFLSLDMSTGLWYDVGYERSLEIALEALAAETTGVGMIMKTIDKLSYGGGGIVEHTAASGAPATVPRVLASKAA